MKFKTAGQMKKEFFNNLEEALYTEDWNEMASLLLNFLPDPKEALDFAKESFEDLTLSEIKKIDGALSRVQRKSANLKLPKSVINWIKSDIEGGDPYMYSDFRHLWEDLDCANSLAADFLNDTKIQKVQLESNNSITVWYVRTVEVTYKARGSKMIQPMHILMQGIRDYDRNSYPELYKMLDIGQVPDLFFRAGKKKEALRRIEIQKFMSQGQFAAMSAYLQNSKDENGQPCCSKSENKRRQTQLRIDLMKGGHKAETLKASWNGTAEQSLFVKGIYFGKANALALRYGQDAIISTGAGAP